MDEQAAFERARAGDRAALGQLLNSHGPRLYRAVLLPRLGTTTLAEEALAVTYLEAVKSFPAFEWLGVGMYPWLRQVALRVALRAVRKSAGESLCAPSDIAREIEESQGESSKLGEEYDQMKARGYVERALEGLGTQHAEALRLRLLEERPREELAARWGVNENAVDQRVHRAKLALRAALNARNDAKEASPLVFVTADSGSGPVVHVFNRATVSIGRAPSSDLTLPGDGVSRHHAVIRLQDSGGYQIEDLASSNGTILRGERLSGAAPLKVGDLVRIGGYALSLVTSPLVSMWARAILAESAGEDSSRMTDGPLSTSALPATAPLSQILRGQFPPADHQRSSAGEERIEELLLSAWQPAELDHAFNSRAVDAVMLSAES